MQKSSRKLATRKFNVIGNMVGHCSVITREGNIKIATKEMQLAATYEDITEGQKTFKSLKHDRLKYTMMDSLPSEITDKKP